MDAEMLATSMLADFDEISKCRRRQDIKQIWMDCLAAWPATPAKRQMKKSVVCPQTHQKQGHLMLSELPATHEREPMPTELA